jgi:hypothetical protein
LNYMVLIEFYACRKSDKNRFGGNHGDNRA